MKGAKGKNIKNTKQTNSVTVDKENLDEMELRDIKAAFDLFDRDHSGEISIAEIKNVFQLLDIENIGKNAKIFMEALDANGDGNITYDEFEDLIVTRNPPRDSKADLERVFDLFTNGEDKISITHLQRVSEELGERWEEEKLQKLIDGADLDRDGLVSFDEFYYIITKAA